MVSLLLQIKNEERPRDMTAVLVTIRSESGETEEYAIDYLPMLEAAYAASLTGQDRRVRHAETRDNKAYVGSGPLCGPSREFRTRCETV